MLARCARCRPRLRPQTMAQAADGLEACRRQAPLRLSGRHLLDDAGAGVRTHAPFRPDDLVALDGLLEQATAVVTMGEIHAGAGPADHRPAPRRRQRDRACRRDGLTGKPSAATARPISSSTRRPTGRTSRCFAARWRRSPARARVRDPQRRARGVGEDGPRPEDDPGRGDHRAALLGFDVAGTVAHGARDCYGPRSLVFVNDQLFRECVRPEYEPGCQLRLPSRASAWPTTRTGSSGARHLRLGRALVAGLRDGRLGLPLAGQLHMLVHPDWWGEAFVSGGAAS